MEITFTKGRLTKEVKAGYSFTVAFFGPIPLAMRGMWGWAVLTAVANIFTYCLGGFLIAAFANKAYAQSLIEKGWEPAEGQELPASWEIA